MIFMNRELVVPEVGPQVNFVEYIESSGEQWIDTGVKAASDTRVICVFQFTKTSSAFQSVFGGRGASSSYAGRYCLHLSSSNTFRSDYYNNNQTFSSSLSATGKHTVDKDGNTCTIDGTTVTNTAGTFTGTYSMALFATNTAGAIGEKANLKIYSCQIYQGKSLVRDYSPCIDSDGIVCLYDEVNEEYVYNSGTGNFTAGGEV